MQALGVWSTDYIPRGTRFGPLVGEVHRKDEVPDHANRSYFWRVYEDKASERFHYLDGCDLSKANWMRFVNAAFSPDSQNLVACQIGTSIYFYTIKHILPHQELLVWYCREFAQRLNYPLSGQLMIQALSESRYPLHTFPSMPAFASAFQSTPDFYLRNMSDFIFHPFLNLHSPMTPTEQQLSPSSNKSIPVKGLLAITSGNPAGSPQDPTSLVPRLTPTDDGYHSTGGPDESLTPPEDSSDSDSDNNAVLDFSVKKDKRTTTGPSITTVSEVCLPCNAITSSCAYSLSPLNPNTGSSRGQEERVRRRWK